MKHKFVILLTTLSVLLTVSGCKEKDNSNFTVTLKAFVGAQPLTFSSSYNDGVSKEFYFSGVKFYLSHVKLIREDNSEVEIKDAAFFDYRDNDWKAFKAEVPAGTYKGIKFGIGLDPAQNQIDPDTRPDTDPLGPQEDMYWEWLKHRFINIEGAADTLGTNFSGAIIGLAYHVGRDETYRTATLSNGNFIVQEGSDKEIFLNLDFNKVFFEGANAIDMFAMPGTQSENNDLYIANQFADKFSTAFTYTE